MTKKKYSEREILYEIEHKIGTLNKTRNNKVKQSLRLEKYNEMWEVVTFILNIEAVIFVILSLSNIKVFEDNSFKVVVSIFSIYVILIQYYVSGQRYGERALKSHYQQLSIEDLILSLKNLFIMKNSEEIAVKKTFLINELNRIMNEYQTILKNNENHSPIDYMSAITENISEKLVRDFTKDNVMIYFNLGFCVLIPIILVILINL